MKGLGARSEHLDENCFDAQNNDSDEASGELEEDNALSNASIEDKTRERSDSSEIPVGITARDSMASNAPQRDSMAFFSSLVQAKPTWLQDDENDGEMGLPDTNSGGLNSDDGMTGGGSSSLGIGIALIPNMREADSGSSSESQDSD